MNLEKINRQGAAFRVLVAPLNWGLGHATRCIPLIHQLLGKGFEVFIAADGQAAEILKESFPGCNHISIPGKNIQYARSPWLVLPKLMVQAPGFYRSIKKENQSIHGWLRQNPVDLIISDNRFGIRHPKIKSVFITHQLGIKTGIGVLDYFAQRINRKLIQKFDECWIPDYAAEPLAGALSHPKQVPAIPVKYIGALSRFSQQQHTIPTTNLLVLLSGPEPQRTLLENMILEQVKQVTFNVCIVRGLPGGNNSVAKSLPSNIECLDHLPAKALEQRIASARNIIARSGYSTVMDLAAMKKHALLVPTPQQGEQEYLAKYLEEKKWFCKIDQRVFNLDAALKKLAEFPFASFPERGDMSTNIPDAIQVFI